MKPDLFG